MAMSGPSLAGDEDEFELNATINTTPLVDVMLVLLIIFLIAVPVVVSSVEVDLPQEANVPTLTTPQNINLSVDRDGNVYWNTARLSGEEELLSRLAAVAVIDPQPEVHIRGDAAARYEHVGKVVIACQRMGIARVAFITLPEPGAGAAAPAGG